jgi:hypothetical protein
MKHKEFASALHRMNVFEYYCMVLPPLRGTEAVSFGVRTRPPNVPQAG